MFRKLCLCTLILCMVFCASAYAQETAAMFPGEGTEESPYLIATSEDLCRLAEVLNDEEAYLDYTYSHFRLTADIALNDCSDFAAWEQNPPANVWTPMGYYHSFKGVFDGDGHTISGLYINQGAGKDAKNHELNEFGLFGRMKGEVRNLTLKDALIAPRWVKGETTPSAGILAGSSNGTVADCTVDGVLICEGDAHGGIVGSNYGDIINCTFTGKLIERDGSSGGSIGGIAGVGGGNISSCSVSAQLISEKAGKASPSWMGGIAGYISAFMNDYVIANCTFSGEIVGGDAAGGIVGHAGSIGAGKNTARATILGCVNNGSVAAYEDAGGIVGSVSCNSGVNEICVDSCTNFGEVRTLANEIEAAGGIVGYIMTEHDGPVIITGCVNEAELCAAMPGGIVGRLMQNRGNVRIEKCVNKGKITGEGSYAAGILCHIQQWGGNWRIAIDQCINEGDIITASNAGGIVCFAFDAGSEGGSMTISGCTNRGSLRSSGINEYMGGVLGVDAMACVPVAITGCVNEGDLEYTGEVLVDAETLSGALVTLSRTSGGMVGYVGTAPYITVNSGARTVSNIDAEGAYLTLENCMSRGRFLHKEASFASDVDEAMKKAWQDAGHNVLDYFIALEGGMVGTIADDAKYSVSMVNCTFEHAERSIDDWNRFE